MSENDDSISDADNPDVCATAGCGRPAALTYLGRPRCQACYEDDVADGNATADQEETDMTKSKKNTAKKTSKKQRGEKKASALDAAAQVLKKAGKPMNCKDLIAAMAKDGLWSSPAGKTPHATLYAAILREIGKLASKARFKKTGRGLFAYSGGK